MTPRPPAFRPALGLIALLVCAAVPIPGAAARLRATLRDDGPNAADRERIERGYYERLTRAEVRHGLPTRRADSPFDAGVLAMPVDDVREYVLRPSLVATHKGARWTSNALGMRDRERDRIKPPGTVRVALVGDSIACGWGVDDGLGFGPIVERIWDGRSSGVRVEVLNFAVPGHAPGQRWEHFGRVGRVTGPDLVIVEATPADLGWDERRLRVLLPRGLGADAPSYHEALAGVALDSSNLKSLLKPQRDAILAGVYRREVADCRAWGVPVVWVLLPRVGKAVAPGDRAKLVGMARAAEFDRVIDLSEAFDGIPASSLAIGPDDFHPNASGHARLAVGIDAALGDLVSSLAAGSRPTGGGPRPTLPVVRDLPGGVDPR